MNRSPFRPRLFPGSRPGFTLIEVLLAVFILALGLLGLGAMVPVVIREQREAADATLGLVVAANAEAYLKNRPDLNRWNDANNAPIGWGVWYGRKNLWSTEYGWETRPKGFKNEGAGPDKDDEPAQSFNVTTGRMRLQIENNATSTPCFIRVQDRLWPDASVGGAQPRFVWDIVGRRLPESAGQPWQIQIAVFVRRLDPNIRVPVGATLYQVLTQQLPDAQWRVPVAVTAGGNLTPAKRQPTLDGTGEYAKPFKVNVRYDTAYTDRIELDPAEPGFAQLWTLFGRPGQKLVDNNSNVYTVVSLNPDLAGNPNSAHWVQVDPPVPEWVAKTDDPAKYSVGTPEYLAACATLRHVILTPQAPAAVSVFTVNVANLAENPSGSGTGNAAP